MRSDHNIGFRGRPAGWLMAALLVPAVALWGVGVIHQSTGYHAFADNRSVFGIPNTADVLSNLPFLLVGALGLKHCLARPRTGAWRAWAAFFLGAALVCAGSMYYHLAPDDDRLVWDRLPMALAFMGLFVALLSEHGGERHERWLLPVALSAGFASVWWWRVSGDLRFYIWVQAAPFLVIACLLLLYRGRYSHRYLLVAGIAAYALGKVAEYYDRELFQATALGISGHSMKHLLAAGSVLIVSRMLVLRRPLDSGAPARQSPDE